MRKKSINVYCLKILVFFFVQLSYVHVMGKNPLQLRHFKMQHEQMLSANLEPNVAPKARFQKQKQFWCVKPINIKP